MLQLSGQESSDMSIDSRIVATLRQSNFNSSPDKDISSVYMVNQSGTSGKTREQKRRRPMILDGSQPQEGSKL